MNAFADYAKKAQSIVDQPQKLIGAMKTRGEARERYTEIVGSLKACASRAELDRYLDSIGTDIRQFHAELEFLWKGDGDEFAGLQREIERAHVRVDDGLDHPRYEEEGLRT